MSLQIRSGFSFAIFIIIALLVVGCAQLSPAPVSQPPDAAPTLPFQPTLPQRTLFPTATTAANDTATPTLALATATTQPAAASPRAPATATVLSTSLAGIFATTIRMRPEKPVSGGDPITFFVNFTNTTGKAYTFKWRIKIWNPDDQRNSFGDTTILTSEIQSGSTELTSSSWKTNPGPCTSYYARVYLVDTNLSPDPIEFRKPDGSNGPQINFQVCPP